jgi:hypothetical protein
MNEIPHKIEGNSNLEHVNEFSLKKLNKHYDNTLAEKNNNGIINIKSIKDFKHTKAMGKYAENNENSHRVGHNDVLGKSKQEDSKSGSTYQPKHSIVDQIYSPNRKVAHL